ncbi:hypothetical protein [Klebsiella aerogenes]
MKEVAKHQIVVRPQALPEHNADGGEAGIAKPRSAGHQNRYGT